MAIDPKYQPIVDALIAKVRRAGCSCVEVEVCDREEAQSRLDQLAPELRELALRLLAHPSCAFWLFHQDVCYLTRLAWAAYN